MSENPPKPPATPAEKFSEAQDEHAEAMHILAQEANGIENPKTLERQPFSMEAIAKKEGIESKENPAEVQPKGNHGHGGGMSWKAGAGVGVAAVASGGLIWAILNHPAAVFYDYLGISLFKAFFLEGGWRSVANDMNPFGKSSGVGGAAPKAKKSSGGGGHAPSGGGGAHH
jgi:hypothetical protein